VGRSTITDPEVFNDPDGTDEEAEPEADYPPAGSRPTTSRDDMNDLPAGAYIFLVVMIMVIIVFALGFKGRK
jgi:hypothetical protein